MGIRTLFQRPVNTLEPRLVTTGTVNGALWLYEDFTDSLFGALHLDPQANAWSYVLFKGCSTAGPKTVVDHDSGFRHQDDARVALRRSASRHG